MILPKFSAAYTSNDLLLHLQTEHPQQEPHYTVIAQSEDEIRDMHNAPAISVGPYLVESGQTNLLNVLSIYSQRGDSRDQLRLFYMNAVALRIWIAMGKKPTVIGSLHRPPRSAVMTLGVPFSE